MQFHQILIAAAVVMFGLVDLASASSVYDLSTGIDVLDPSDGHIARDAGWMVTAVPSTDPNGVSTPYDAYVISPHAQWQNVAQWPGTAEPAMWVSADPDYASTGYDGQYVYELVWTVAPGTYRIAGEFNSDNGVSQITINGALILEDVVERGDFRATAMIPSDTSGSDDNGLLRMRVVTENLDSDGTNPTGFIFSGTATAMPLPAAAWAGLVLLGWSIRPKRKLRGV